MHSFCEESSHFRNIPIYRLESAIGDLDFLSNSRKIVPEDDPDEVADEVISFGLDEMCWSLYFEASFFIRLIYSGFLPICTNLGPHGDPIYCLLPKLHYYRSLAAMENFTIPKRVKKQISKYVLHVNEIFCRVVDQCCLQHGERCWLYPPFRRLLADLHSMGSVCSIELMNRDSGDLVAGEIGYTVGTIYTSMTGFYTESGAGTVQLHMLRQLLVERGYEVWDLGMEMEYKTNVLGARQIERSVFVNEIVRKFRTHLPERGLDT